MEYLDTLDPFRGRLAAVLKMDGLEQWDGLLKLYQRDTHVDVAFWNIFLTCSSYLLSTAPRFSLTRLAYCTG